mmetsp:Transcript_46707/g.105326  ORF Transcript_46707/g.105326 Transcript_46707/m.105326 type:complete len:309 (+) Transcript_46707:1028-1954(+)
MHKRDPFGDEHHGAWFMYAKGSGVWYHLGKYITFKEHADAWGHFAQGNEKMCQAAASAGYDSVIFLAHHDHVNYPCDQACGAPYMNIEIVAVKLQGTYTCGVNGKPDKSILRSGWATEACDCDNSLETTNCGKPHEQWHHGWGEHTGPSDEQQSSKEGTMVTDCSANQTSARDPEWFVSCNETGGCLRVTLASRRPRLSIVNSTRGKERTNGFLWCIDHTNMVVYLQMNAAAQPKVPPYFAAYFAVEDAAFPGNSCRFLATHWTSGNIANVYEHVSGLSGVTGQLNCKVAYTPSPGSDSVTNVTLYTG